MKVFHCLTCAWVRRHDEQAEPGLPGRWCFAPSDGMAFHHLDHPGHLMGFNDSSLDPPPPVLTAVEYALGAAYLRGTARGREFVKKAMAEALEKV